MSKEHAVIKFIEKELPDYQWHIKKHIKKANRYSDIYLDLGHIIIIIEIDENQHRNYKDEYERMKEISKALSKPTIFIRFNPDSYYDCNGQFHKSCWEKVNGENILSEEEHDDRLWNLSTVIMSLLNCNEIDELPYISIEDGEKLFYIVHKLYYDKYNSGFFDSDPFYEDNYEIYELNSETDSEEEDDLDDDEIQSKHDTDNDWKSNCEDKSESESEYDFDKSASEHEDSESDDDTSDDSDESESEYDFDKSASEYEDSESDDDCTPPPSKRQKID